MRDEVIGMGLGAERIENSESPGELTKFYIARESGPYRDRGLVCHGQRGIAENFPDPCLCG